MPPPTVVLINDEPQRPTRSHRCRRPSDGEEAMAHDARSPAQRPRRRQAASCSGTERWVTTIDRARRKRSRTEPASASPRRTGVAAGSRNASWRCFRPAGQYLLSGGTEAAGAPIKAHLDRTKSLTGHRRRMIGLAVAASARAWTMERDSERDRTRASWRGSATARTPRCVTSAHRARGVDIGWNGRVRVREFAGMDASRSEAATAL